MSFTLVAFHAHPDDEVLLTGGTLARVAAEGHRVVLVTATAGEAGLSGGEPSDLGVRRAAELAASAEALGCARVVLLGYPDSGSASPPVTDPGGPMPFAHLPAAEPAARLRDILIEERADVLTVYDARGGYGHPDHVQVHRVGHLAADMAGTQVVLEATVDRDLLQRVARVMAWIPGLSGLVPADGFAHAYTLRSDLTHRVDVRRQLASKRAALAAHRTQGTGGASIRTLTLLHRLPPPLRGKVLGQEWYRERGRPRAAALLDDVFASLR